ncbi:MAG: peptide deformylase [Agromyces sp.]
MPIRAICISGEPVLHSPAREVESITDEIRELVADMFETMDAAPGVGLAAPQIGVDLRIFTFGWTDETGTDWRGVAINPELLITPPSPFDADPEDDTEGCLSFPGERFPLQRAERAVLRALDLDGNPFEIDATGWLARIFQHEFDHLNGILYVDRLGETDRKLVHRITKKAGWGVPGCSWMPGVDYEAP